MSSAVPASGAIDLASDAFYEDPYPTYARLREDHPVYRDPAGFYLLTRYADVYAAARDPERFSSARGIGPLMQNGQTMVSKDPPDHTRLRRLTNKAFSLGAIERLAPRIQAAATELVDALAARSEFDLMTDLAEPLPTVVIAELLGIDAARRTDFRRWSTGLVEFVSRAGAGESTANYVRCVAEFHAYLTQVIAARREQPRDDLVSLLVQARDEHDALSNTEVYFTCHLLLTAGNEAVSNLIGNIAVTLLRHPEQAALVAADPASIPGMIEEVARFESPVQMLFRTTTRAVELHGETIPAGVKVGLCWGAANRDPNAFAEPDRFDPFRSPNPHLGFGTGIHFCLGTALARLQLKIVAETLLNKLVAVRAIPNRPFRRHRRLLLRGLVQFPLVPILRGTDRMC